MKYINIKEYDNMESSNTYKKFDDVWLKLHDCQKINEFNEAYRVNNQIDDEDFLKVFITKELDSTTWELNLEVSDDDEYVTYEAIEVRFCPYCSDALKEGMEEVPEDLKRVMYLR